MTPTTAQRATLEEDRQADTGAVVNRVTLDVEDEGLRLSQNASFSVRSITSC